MFFFFLKINQTVSQSVILNIVLTHTKPCESLIRLVQLAITSTDEQKMTLQQIKDWLKNNYPYYRSQTTRWENSLRRCLSHNDCFSKIPGVKGNGKKNCFWVMHEDAQHMFENGSYRRRAKRFRLQTNKKPQAPNVAK